MTNQSCMSVLQHQHPTTVSVSRKKCSHLFCTRALDDRPRNTYAICIVMMEKNYCDQGPILRV
jgi:hypothetical protein